jgi:hypothetical protein
METKKSAVWYIGENWPEKNNLILAGFAPRVYVFPPVSVILLVSYSSLSEDKYYQRNKRASNIVLFAELVNYERKLLFMLFVHP